ncbi:hypothetical protein L596_001999 [Steinernema carpocapsae]|uniref:Uncharacterized protein n=1 Tax=Steinernema carpocapsae TaxID=34508 RepID=A0A4V6I7J6_STECR|nr:hypothetical protein L596_001999 [Steinernema carpocapsae]
MAKMTACQSPHSQAFFDPHSQFHSYFRSSYPPDQDAMVSESKPSSPAKKALVVIGVLVIIVIAVGLLINFTGAYDKLKKWILERMKEWVLKEMGLNNELVRNLLKDGGVGMIGDKAKDVVGGMKSKLGF